jgi:hypothetical protein
MKQKTITIWECQDCGALYAERATCWCCVDMEGHYTGKRGKYEIKCLGTYTAAQIKRLRPFRGAGKGEG